MVIIQSCGEQTVSSLTGGSSTYSPTAATIYTGDSLIEVDNSEESLQVDSKDYFSESVDSGYLFTLSESISGFSIAASSGIITVDNQNVEAGLYSVTVIASPVGIGNSFSAAFSIAVNSDPLWGFAWHLENERQSTFSRDSVEYKSSMANNLGNTVSLGTHIADVHADGITGNGVRIAISDVGVEINHDDLVDNGLDGLHRDYSLSSPYAGDPIPTSAHGTAVTGIINAIGWNNMGSRGVAPKAKFAGFQFINSLQSTSILIHQAQGDFNIFNFSYGDSLFEDTLSDDDYLDHLKYQALNNNKFFVKAAGNEYLSGVGNVCAPHNANAPYENESPFMIVVGAVSGVSTNGSEGWIKSTYSNAGSNLWVSAPGGEYGEFEPAILTTDLPTCLKGYSKATSGLNNDFEYGHELNTQCHYTSTMNGTSSAAPVVSGVIALILEANPDLSFREVKDILAKTAIRVNPNGNANYFAGSHPSNVLTGCNSLNLSGHDYELGWIENDAGFYFNNFYGFGMVDAKAAVDLAKTYVSGTMGTLTEQNAAFNVPRFSSSPGSTIPNNDASGVTDTITISSDDALTVESVQVKVNVTHTDSGQVGVELTSPKGTKSILLNINNSFLLLDDDDNGVAEGDSNLNTVLTSHAFYGESSVGTWTIKVIDGQSSANNGKLNSWKINILGH